MTATKSRGGELEGAAGGPGAAGRREPARRETEPVSAGKTEIGTLIRELANDTRTLVQQEIELAKMETARSVRRVLADSAWIGMGAAVIGLGGLCLVLALALGVGALLDSYWLGTLITGGALFFTGALLAWKGVRDVRKGGFTPTVLTESLREDREWAGREMDQIKQALGKDES